MQLQELVPPLREQLELVTMFPRPELRSQGEGAARISTVEWEIFI